MRGHLAFYAYRLLARFAEILPASAIGPVSKFVGGVGRSVSPSKAKLVRSHIARVKGKGKVKGLDATDAEVRSAFVSYVRYWLEALRLPVVSSQQLEKSVHADGLEHIANARDGGRGVILAVPHVGNWDVAGAWLVKWGLPVTVVVEKLEPPKLRQWFGDFRESLGMTVLVNDGNAGTQLMNALRRGEAIALLCDRDVDGSGFDIEFFGETTSIPKGPAMLAIRSGAALLPSVSYEAEKGHHIVIGPPVEIAREGSLRDDVARATIALTKRIEALIESAPSQWHLFQPNWPSERT